MVIDFTLFIVNLLPNPLQTDGLTKTDRLAKAETEHRITQKDTNPKV